MNLFLIFFISISMSQAETSPELTEYFETELRILNEELNRPEVVWADNHKEDDFFFRRIFFRFRPKVAFGISSVLRIEIQPEIEFVWDKSLPEGWTVYRP